MSDKYKFGDADGTYFTTTTVEDDREKDQLGLEKVIFYLVDSIVVSNLKGMSLKSTLGRVIFFQDFARIGMPMTCGSVRLQLKILYLRRRIDIV